jgi:hypothetical protein
MLDEVRGGSDLVVVMAASLLTARGMDASREKGGGLVSVEGMGGGVGGLVSSGGGGGGGEGSSGGEGMGREAAGCDNRNAAGPVGGAFLPFGSEGTAKEIFDLTTSPRGAVVMFLGPVGGAFPLTLLVLDLR